MVKRHMPSWFMSLRLVSGQNYERILNSAEYSTKEACMNVNKIKDEMAARQKQGWGYLCFCSVPGWIPPRRVNSLDQKCLFVGRMHNKSLFGTVHWLYSGALLTVTTIMFNNLVTVFRYTSKIFRARKWTRAHLQLFAKLKCSWRMVFHNYRSNVTSKCWEIDFEYVDRSLRLS